MEEVPPVRSRPACGNPAGGKTVLLGLSPGAPVPRSVPARKVLRVWRRQDGGGSQRFGRSRLCDLLCEGSPARHIQAREMLQVWDRPICAKPHGLRKTGVSAVLEEIAPANGRRLQRVSRAPICPAEPHPRQDLVRGLRQSTPAKRRFILGRVLRMRRGQVRTYPQRLGPSDLPEMLLRRAKKRSFHP